MKETTAWPQSRNETERHNRISTVAHRQIINLHSKPLSNQSSSQQKIRPTNKIIR